MAAKLRKTHQEDVRLKISAALLVKYLQDHALSNIGYKNANTRVRAAIALLNKIIPDRSATEISGDGGGPIEIIHRML